MTDEILYTKHFIAALVYWSCRRYNSVNNNKELKD